MTTRPRRLLAMAGLLLGSCSAPGERPEPGARVDTMRELPGEVSPVLPRARLVPADSLARYEEYATAERFEGRPAPVRVGSASYGRLFRTRLRQGAAQGPNFAGRYTVVLWGCGSGCQQVAVVDARTGRLSREILQTSNGVAYRRDSRLIVADPVDPANPPPPDCASCGHTSAYQWDGERFQPVGPGPHPHVAGPRPS